MKRDHHAEVMRREREAKSRRRARAQIALGVAAYYLPRAKGTRHNAPMYFLEQRGSCRDKVGRSRGKPLG